MADCPSCIDGRTAISAGSIPSEPRHLPQGGGRAQRAEPKPSSPLAEVPPSVSTVLPDSHSIAELIGPSAVAVGFGARTVRQVMNLIADKAAQNFGLDAGVVLAALLEREQAGSTGIGRGVAAPHARVAGLERSGILIVRLDQPIAFEAIDGLPVDLFFALLSPPESGVEHLRMLARISRLLRREDLREQLRRAADADAIRFLLVRGETAAA